MSPPPPARRESQIWWFALGYFAAYVPYSALTKAVSSGHGSGVDRPIAGLELLPASVLASTVGMFAFLSAARWWRFASTTTVLGRTLPAPRRTTLLSGACTAVIVMTTTLAYTFDGVSIVFMMLLMRGGVLVIAPIVDLVAKRRVRAASWVALALSLASLGVAYRGPSRLEFTVAAGVDVALYLIAYFVRLRVMSSVAKSQDADTNKRYFVEEQMIATPLCLAILFAFAWLPTSAGEAVQRGFFELPWTSALPVAVAIGLCSQATGVFGGLIFLDARENSFTVPVNRASSVLAGVASAYALWLTLGEAAPARTELAGAFLIVVAIVVLASRSRSASA